MTIGPVDLLDFRRFCQDGEDQAVRACVAKGLSANTDFDNGSRPLHSAAGRGNTSTCRLLVKLGAEVNLPDGQGRVALDHAAAEHVDTAWALMDMGANVHLAHDESRSRLLHDACAKVDEERLRRLLGAGVSPSLVDATGKTIMHHAAASGLMTICKVALQHGAEVDARDRGGRTPLHAAVMEGYWGTASWYIKHGADINAVDGKGDNVLNLAAFSSANPMFQLLLLHGADPERAVPGKDTGAEHAWHNGMDRSVAACLALTEDFDGLRGRLAQKRYRHGLPEDRISAAVLSVDLDVFKRSLDRMEGEVVACEEFRASLQAASQLLLHEASEYNSIENLAHSMCRLADIWLARQMARQAIEEMGSSKLERRP